MGVSDPSADSISSIRVCVNSAAQINEKFDITLFLV